MASLVNCVFCKDSDVSLILFAQETLKRCQVILKHRKEHNLKFKDVVLPGDLFESGYHRQCYKSFTGLNKKYFLPKSKSIIKSNSEEKLSNITENSSVESSTTVELDIASIEPEASTSQHSNSTTDFLPDPITIPSPSILPESVETVFPNVQDDIEHLENIDLLSDSNTEVDTGVSNTQKSITCI
ncbi:unnamed protein product [Euphydryas editha]|uniref:THAP-type domain-containing protein n=1 Tax=Euphydryas editha TaxID=104508 RepID=A0AAU9V153_EUPED|nr:unnamed protein product [Euphydryas editha]